MRPAIWQLELFAGDYTPNWSGIVADIDANNGQPRSFTAQGSSSRGGTRINGETTLRQQPVLMGPTGVNTTVDLGGPTGDEFIVLNKSGNNLEPDPNNSPNFFGTSAAAPHVAGAAALMIQGVQKYLTDESGALLVDPTEYTARKLLLDYAVPLAGQSEVDGRPVYDVANGNGFLSVDDALGSFANPAPGFERFNYDDLLATDPDYVPGSEPFYLEIEGTEFTSETEVLFRGDPLTQNPLLANGDPGTLTEQELPDYLQTYWVIDENTIALYLDAFIGDPAIIISTPPNDGLTNGTDGGDVEAPPVNEITPVDVVVKPVNATLGLWARESGFFIFAV